MSCATSLIDLLGSDGRGAGKAYRLKLSLNRYPSGVALQNDATITATTTP